MTTPSFEDAPTIVWPPDPRDLAYSEETTHHGRNGTLIMPAFVPPGGELDAAPPASAETTVDGAPSAQIRHQLDEMSLVIEPATLTREAAPIEDEVQAGPAPAGRRLTFAALRALPARVTSLPPAPARSTYTPPIQARTTVLPSRIEGIPILAIGDATPAAHAAPAPAPVEARAQFDSLAPTTATPLPAPFFPVHAVEVPPRPANQGRWLQLVAACTFLGVLVTVGVLRATNRIGPTSGSTPIAAEAAPTPAAPRPAAAEPTPAPAPAEEQAAAPAADTTDDMEVEPAATASAAAARPTGKAPRATSPSQKASAGKDHDIQVDSLFYGHSADERSVTLQLDGQSVILREGDVASDLQVEKILPDGVIFRRGKRLFAVYDKR